MREKGTTPISNQGVEANIDTDPIFTLSDATFNARPSAIYTQNASQ